MSGLATELQPSRAAAPVLCRMERCSSGEHIQACDCGVCSSSPNHVASLGAHLQGLRLCQWAGARSDRECFLAGKACCCGAASLCTSCQPRLDPRHAATPRHELDRVVHATNPELGLGKGWLFAAGTMHPPEVSACMHGQCVMGPLRNWKRRSGVSTTSEWREATKHIYYSGSYRSAVVIFASPCVRGTPPRLGTSVCARSKASNLN